MIKRFLLGEKRLIQYRVYSSRDYEKIVISNAKYTILKGEEIVRAGKCDISSEFISMIFDCDEIGDFLVEIEYEIAPELRKVRCRVNVSYD